MGGSGNKKSISLLHHLSILLSSDAASLSRKPRKNKYCSVPFKANNGDSCELISAVLYNVSQVLVSSKRVAPRTSGNVSFNLNRVTETKLFSDIQ